MVWHHDTGVNPVASGPPRLQDIPTHLEDCTATPSSVSLSDAGLPKAGPPSQLRLPPDPITPKTERCSVCCARWVMDLYKGNCSLTLDAEQYWIQVPNPVLSDQLRPLSLSSILVRCLHKVLADRSSRRLQLPSLNFAFLHRDGCLEATSLLHAIPRHPSATASNFSLEFVDISKAFDSVTHDKSVGSAEAFGATSHLVPYITQSYEKAAAVFPSSEVHCHRGVRQGDPLSPIDEAHELSMPQLG
ncbi:hypothetical protein T265_02670 [Opisthorchis viverrini]|uniref:Reverse transcriptase domain-containing protein n=1 Tax=Opisthorchis viverrini TaxID=6198 RepID=A0A074ZYC1_OPIVI|nr:hypothetical protein T265_02670 [Opisthorchis viverrini]KER30992.1 hypothetical protein T265_02670 [Opisthorchis viverrini]